MNILRYTLLSDGPSDKALIPHLTWLLKSNGVKVQIDAEWADLRRLREMPEGLTEKIEKSIAFFPCDLLFIHRDAERQTPDARRQEISVALQAVSEAGSLLCVCVIPVKMQEAWLLFNEHAIRRASGNPSGRTVLKLPKPNKLEQIADPKNTLFELLRTASERTGRRLKSFNVHHSASQVSQFIEDFSPLRNLSAFQTLERDIKDVIDANNWK